MSLRPTTQAASPAALSCPHERRPGTSVCLHCRHVELAARRARRNRVVGNVIAAGVVAGVVIGGIAAVIPTITGTRATVVAEVAPAIPATPERPATPAAISIATPHEVRMAPVAAQDSGGSAVGAAPVAATPPSDPVSPAVAGPPLPAAAAADSSASSVALAAAKPVIAAPPTVADAPHILPDNVSIVRSDRGLRVLFDTPELRTRRADKLEQIIRSTLRAAYGPRADSLLASLPAGGVAAAGNVLTELPLRGIRLSTPGVTVVLYPETRPGRDGPLVVAYRVLESPDLVPPTIP